MILRDYQDELVTGARLRLRAGVRRPLVVAPTGAGKTVMAAFMQGGAAARGQRTWFTVHRREILERTAETFAENGLDFGMVLDGYPMRPDAPIQLCGVQSLVGRMDDLPPPDGVVWDEAHHIVAGDHATIAERVQHAWQVGLTGTPERLDGTGLGDFFDELVMGPTPGSLMRRGFLSSFRYFSPGTAEDMFGGANMLELAEAMGTAKLIGSAVEHWHTHAYGMRTIGFEMNRKASEATVAAFRGAGVEAWHVDGVMHRDQRKELFRAFRAGEITYLSQVAIAGEGVDIPGAECALLRYKSNSLTKYLQDVGRVFRPVYADGMPTDTDEERLAAIAAGPKPFAAILDMGGNVYDFGTPDSDRSWVLQGSKERRKLERVDDRYSIHQCPECFQITASTVRVCPCGHPFQVAAAGAGAWADGTLFELKDPKVAAAQAKEEKRAREKAEQRGASLGQLMALAHARNQEEPGRYKSPKGWALQQIKLREQYRRGARRGAR